MLRLAELGFVVGPLAILALFLIAAPRGGLSRRGTAMLVLVIVVAGAGLWWVGLRERLPAGSSYVPAQIRDGQVVPGHGA